MANNVRYDSKTWQSRPSTSTWKILRRLVGYPKGQTDLSLPPKFGHCIDVLRDNYNIYISVTPHMQTVSMSGAEAGVRSEIVFHFLGSCIVMEKMGTITKEFNYTGQEFATVMNSALAMAGTYLNNKFGFEIS